MTLHITDDPLGLSWPEMPMSRIGIIDNSGLSWGLSLLQSYCAARGIPTANIKSYDFGSSLSLCTTKSSQANFNAMLDEFAAWAVSNEWLAVLIGPSVPLLIRGPEISESTYAYTGATRDGTPETIFRQLYTADYHKDRFAPTATAWDYGFAVYPTGGIYSVVVFQDGGIAATSERSKGLPPIVAGSTAIRYVVGTKTDLADAAEYEISEFPATGGSPTYVRFYDPALATPFHNRSGQPAVLATGRLGAGYIYPDQYNTITEAIQTAIMGKVTAEIPREKSRTLGECRNRTIHFQIGEIAGIQDLRETQAWMIVTLRALGFGNVNYHVHWDQTATGYAPTTYMTSAGIVDANATYSTSDVYNNNVVIPYDVLLGEDNNTADATSKALWYADALTRWAPNQGGVEIITGPSNGGRVGLWAPLYPGDGSGNGIAGASQVEHPSGFYIERQCGILYKLLTGMTMLEAHFIEPSFHIVHVYGDPLARPFPRNAPANRGKLRLSQKRKRLPSFAAYRYRR